MNDLIPRLSVVAQEDGGKWMCMPLEPEGPECVVYSLGSASNYYFEEDILRLTSCKVCGVREASGNGPSEMHAPGT